MDEMAGFVDALADALNAPQAWLTNVAALAGIATFVLSYLYFWPKLQQAKPETESSHFRGYRISSFWRLVPIPFSVLRLLGLARATSDRSEIVAYLQEFVRDMGTRNAGAPVASSAGTLAGSSELHKDPSDRRNPGVQVIRRALRLLSSPVRGGGGFSAQLASVSQKSRLVRNAARVLRRVVEPLVLLGDPGSGKSYTLRRVAIELALFEMGRPDPRVVVFVPLREYTSTRDGRAGSVRELIALSIGKSDHIGLRAKLPRLTSEGRLVVVFDGMDEMPRRMYRERVQRLSMYAKRNQGHVKTLFSCRINDFAPEFVHRQMVLLPFGRRQVAEYLRKNLDFPIPLEGKLYSRASRVADHLMGRPGMADVAVNPLMLSLITGHFANMEEWPTTRAELFRSYVNRQYRQKIDPHSAMPESLYSGCARLAYMITRAHAGTVGDVTKLARELGGDAGETAIGMAEKCGFLLREPDQPSRVVFSHHQLQEFFTAVHLSKSGDREIPWKDLLEHPRWQETLICLSSIAPRVTGIQVLSESLALERTMNVDVVDEEDRDREFGWDYPLEDDVEGALAERVLLASQILRETRSTRREVPVGLVENFRVALRYLAGHGRPTSQVKMLWSWKYAPDEDAIDALSGPLRSRIHWVRNQAVEVVCGMARGRRHVAPDLSFEMGVDLCNGHLWRRIAVYWRGIWARKSLWAACALVCGLVLRSCYVLSLVLLAVPFWGTTLLAEAPSYWGVSAAVAGLCAVVGVSMVVIWRVYWIGWAAALLYSTVLGWVVVNVVAELSRNEWARAVGETMLGGVAIIGVAVVGSIVYWATVAFHALLFRGRVSRGRSLFGLAAEQPVWLLQREVLGAGISASMLMGGVALLVWLEEQAGGELFGYVMSIWLLLVVVWGGVWVIRRIGFVKMVASLGITAVVGLALAMYGGVIWDVLKRIWDWVAEPVVAVGIGGTVAIMMAVLAVGRLMSAIRSREERVRSAGPEEWRERLITLSERGQARELRRVARDRLGLRPEEFLGILHTLEKRLTTWKDPVATPYWKLRAELRQSIRQDGLEPTADFLKK